MKSSISFLLLFICLVAQGCAQKNQTITTFILLRHAEKGNDGTEDPDLKPEGAARAERIADMLKDIPVTAVYSTNYKRTRNTVLPLAKAKNMDVQLYETFKPEAIEQMVTKHAGGTVVLVGHSNTTPWTANLLIGKEEYKDFSDQEYGTMLIVAVVEKGKVAKVTRINY